MRSICVKVPLLEGESVRKKLSESGALRRDLKPKSRDGNLYLPINVPQPGLEMDEADFEENVSQPHSYKDIVDVPDELRASLPTALDVVGSIALVKLPDEFLEYKQAIGEAILRANKAVRSVYADEGVEGEFRLRQVELLAGVENTETIHREYGAHFEVDVARAYFSPRLATEHWRVTNLVSEGARVLDMFAGVGPFSILIALNRNPVRVHAIDLNPDAYFLLERNVKRNDTPSVVPIQGDARELVPGLGTHDMVIMGLPHDALAFIDVAMDACAPGGLIIYYDITDDEGLERSIQGIEEAARRSGRSVAVERRGVVRNYSATLDHHVLDLKMV